MLPTFIVIGAQKTGTKWLYKNLNTHPDVYLPPGGGDEVHYLNGPHYGDVQWWRDHYRPKHGESLFGDITPDYAHVSEMRIRHAYQHAPRAKILYVLRNPKDRAISALRMAHKKTEAGYRGEPVGPIIDLNGSLSHLIDFCEHGEGWQHGNYPLNLRRWRSVYPEVRLFSYDLLCERPHEYLRRILSYIGASTPDGFAPYPVERRIHKSNPYPVPNELLSHLDRIYDPLIERMAPGLPFDVSGWLKPAGEK